MHPPLLHYVVTAAPGALVGPGPGSPCWAGAGAREVHVRGTKGEQDERMVDASVASFALLYSPFFSIFLSPFLYLSPPSLLLERVRDREGQGQRHGPGRGQPGQRCPGPPGNSRRGGGGRRLTLTPFQHSTETLMKRTKQTRIHVPTHTHAY